MERELDEPNRTVEITLQSADTPISGIPVKIVDERAAAGVFTALVGRVDPRNGLPEAHYQEFFDALPPVAGLESLSTDRDGKVIVTRLRAQHFVVAFADHHLWIAAASETRDWKLQLDPQHRDGQRVLEVLVAQPAVLHALLIAAREARNAGHFEQARILARTARSQPALAEIDRVEANEFLARAQREVEQKNYDAGRQWALLADRLVPDQARTRELLQNILIEYGAEVRTITAHNGGATGAAFSPDGQLVLSGGEDEYVKLWDASTGRSLRTFGPHHGAVTAVAFSPDGSEVVSGCDDSELRLWDISTGQLVRATDNRGWKITSVAFSPDGKWLVSGADDNQLSVWPVPPTKRLRTLTGHGWRVTSVAFTPDGKCSLSGSEDDSLKLWDMATGAEVRSFRNGLADVYGVAVSPNGRLGLSGGKDGVVKIWNLVTGREAQTLRGHTRAVRSVVFTHNGRFALSAGEDGTIRVWDLSAGQSIRTFTGHKGTVTSVAVSPDSHFAASAGVDGTIRIWQLPHQVWPLLEEARR